MQEQQEQDDARRDVLGERAGGEEGPTPTRPAFRTDNNAV